MIYIVVSTLRFCRVTRTACLVASATSEAIDHMCMRSATATANQGNGRDVVVRAIVSDLDDTYVVKRRI